jgi:hypothetical protein
MMHAQRKYPEHLIEHLAMLRRDADPRDEVAGTAG